MFQIFPTKCEEWKAIFALFLVLSGQHLPFLSKNPLFKGLSEDQHLPSDLPYTSPTPPVTPPIIRLLSCTGGLWEVYGRC